MTAALSPEDFGIGRLFAEVRDAVVIAELESGRVVLWNPAAETLFGYGRVEAIGMPLHVLVPEELKERHHRGITRYAATRRGDLVDSHKPVELPAVTKDGTRIDVELQFAPISVSPDGGVYMSAFIRDISERKKLESERARLARDMALLLDSTGEGFYGLDVNGVCTFINSSGAEIFGYREKEVVGTEMHNLVHHSHDDGSAYPAEECPIIQTLRTGRSHRVYDESMWRKDGAPFPARYTSFPIIDEGRLTGAVVSVEDITPRKRLEEALRDRNEQLSLAFEKEQDAVKRLRDLDVLKNEFVAMVAHDLRSPMTVIGGMADTLIQRGDSMDEEKKRTFLQMISESITRLSDLVEDVLVVARIESDEFSYELDAFDLGVLVNRVVADLGAETAGHAIEVTVADAIPDAYGDEQRTWQVVTNLISNALKFSPEDAVVEVGVEHDDDDMLRVDITDHGIGMGPEEQSKLFQKFSRLSQSGLERKVPGTGLGLYICKRIVEDQKGSISVESALGEGSTFSFTLPVVPEGTG